jgi:hypothetical protein
MAGLQGVTLGNKLLPQGILEGYAKAKLNDSKIKAAVPDFVQIQHNIVDSFTNIIRFEIEMGCIYIAILSHDGIKKPPGGRSSMTLPWVCSTRGRHHEVDRCLDIGIRRAGTAFWRHDAGLALEAFKRMLVQHGIALLDAWRPGCLVGQLRRTGNPGAMAGDAGTVEERLAGIGIGDGRCGGSGSGGRRGSSRG